MNDDLAIEAPSLVSVGAQQLVADANRLGLRWQIRLGTVVMVSSDFTKVFLILDGDTVAVRAVPMSGSGFIVGARTYVVETQQGSYYIFGLTGPLVASSSVSFAPVANTPTSASVSWGVALPGTVHVTVSAESSVPGSQVIECSMNQITATGCTVWLYRTNSATTRLHVIACGSHA